MQICDGCYKKIEPHYTQKTTTENTDATKQQQQTSTTLRSKLAQHKITGGGKGQTSSGAENSRVPFLEHTAFVFIDTSAHNQLQRSTEMKK